MPTDSARPPSSRVERWFYPVVAGLLFFVAFLGISRARAASSALSAELLEARRAQVAQRESILRSTQLGLQLLGKEVRWPALEEVTTLGSPSSARRKSYLLLLFSEVSCDVCQDRLTQFGVSLAQQDRFAVRAVLAARARRYALAYTRTNGVNFPVYFDPQDEFGRANGQLVRPIMAVVRDERVVLAHVPIPADEEFSRPFHEAALDALQMRDRLQGPSEMRRDLLSAPASR